MLAAEADEKVCNIVQLIYDAKNYEGIAKDFEFSRRTMEEHWAAGYEDVVRAISHPEIMQRPDKMEGVRTFDWSHSGQKSAVFDFDQQRDEGCDERK
jgi:NTE family protein